MKTLWLFPLTLLVISCNSNRTGDGRAPDEIKTGNERDAGSHDTGLNEGNESEEQSSYLRFMGNYEHNWKSKYIEEGEDVPFEGSSKLSLVHLTGRQFSFCLLTYETNYACDDEVQGFGEFYNGNRAKIKFESYDDTINAEIEFLNNRLIFHDLNYVPCPKGFIGDTLVRMQTSTYTCTPNQGGAAYD